jgi:ribosomal protein S27E
MTMSKSAKIAKCGICGEEKTIFYEEYSESPKYEKLYCEEYYYHRKEKVKCERCDQEVAREDKVDHDRDYHSEI